MSLAGKVQIIPTPFDMLVRFQDSGNATLIGYLLREKADWLTRNLSPGQLAICDDIRAKLAIWLDREHEHGPGAALNLSHPQMMELFREQPWVRRKYAGQIANAERLATLQHGD